MAKRAGYKVVGLPNYVVWHIDTEEKVSREKRDLSPSRIQTENANEIRSLATRRRLSLVIDLHRGRQLHLYRNEKSVLCPTEFQERSKLL
jgi:hypothetical protein